VERRPGFPGETTWSIETVPYHTLMRERVRDDGLLFYVLASASFVEITSDLYTRNLIEFFGDDREVNDWLANSWEKEELQHGAALKRYVEIAWPEFDWNAAYGSFCGAYHALCSVDQLARTRALELAARCVVETGTASFYRMLSKMTTEPVLKRLARDISADEVRHYKHFYRHFLRYRERERPSRGAVTRALWTRIAEVDAEDAFCALKHVYLGKNPGAEFRASDYRAFRHAFQKLAMDHFPYGMAVKMLLQPLLLGGRIRRVAVPAMTSTARLVVGWRATTNDALEGDRWMIAKQRSPDRSDVPRH